MALSQIYYTYTRAAIQTLNLRAMLIVRRCPARLSSTHHYSLLRTAILCVASLVEKSSEITTAQ